MRFSKKPKKSIGLALSGGSSWGIAHVGVIKALQEEGIRIDYLAGTSAGALVAACYAFGMSVEDMTTVATSLDWKKLSRFGYSRLGLRSNQPMEKFMIDLVGDVQIEDAEIPLAIVATDLHTHEKVVFETGSLAHAVRASTAIPGFFVPVAHDDRTLVDGSVSENLPIPTVRSMGAEYIVGVNLFSKPSRPRPRSMFGVLFSSFSAVSYHRDHALGTQANVLIEPDLSQFDAMKFNDAEKILHEGYTAAMAVMPKLREQLGIKKPKKKKKTVTTWRSFLKRLFGRP